VNASYEHRFDLGSFGTLIPQIDVQWKDDYVLSFNQQFTEGTDQDFETGAWQYYNYPWNFQEAHYMLNGSLVFNHSSGIWSLRAYAKNITDIAVKNGLIARADRFRLGISDPRTYGFVFSLSY